MIHIYGHTWPVRWGRPDESRQVKVFSNCDTVELFLNGTSLGIRKRDITDFPAAGLRWDVHFREGANRLRAVGRRNGQELSDEIPVTYQTAAWTKPAKLTLKETGRTNETVTIEVRAFDAAGVPCLDAANLVRFGVTGDGHLLDNLGTAGGSRSVQLANGRAQISLQLTGREVVASVASDGMPTEFVHLTAKP
jgi:beta-galactosidase